MLRGGRRVRSLPRWQGEARHPFWLPPRPPDALPEIPEKMESAPTAPAPAAPALAAAAPVVAAPVVAAPAPVVAAPAPVLASAEPAPAAAGGYFAQVKSDQSRKAAEAELAAVAEKHRAVLGEMPLTIKSADLKDKGTWFRVLIGPVKSHDDAENLCKRLKGSGLQDCIVQKLD